MLMIHRRSVYGVLAYHIHVYFHITHTHTHTHTRVCVCVCVCVCVSCVCVCCVCVRQIIVAGHTVYMGQDYASASAENEKNWSALVFSV